MTLPEFSYIFNVLGIELRTGEEGQSLTNLEILRHSEWKGGSNEKIGARTAGTVPAGRATLAPTVPA